MALLSAPGCGSEAPESSFAPRTASPATSADQADGGGVDPGTGPGEMFVGDLQDASPAPTTKACTNLQCKQVACTGAAHTTVSGQIFDPAGKNPLYNVVVYVPNSTPKPFTDRSTCEKCSGLYTGDPIVTTLTGPDGKFTLTDVPVGKDIPIVLQIGKWRRQITLPNVASCVDTPVTDKNLTRLPRNRAEGDLPKIAISTGGADSMECLLKRVGVDSAEFTSGTGAERIHIFQGTEGKTVAGGSPTSASTLWPSATALEAFDMVVLSCEGAEYGETKPDASLQALLQYANAGGRIFASHFHYYWFNHGPAPLPSTATWTPGGNDIGTIRGTIDQTFPKGVAFAQWMKNTSALAADGTVRIEEARHNANVDVAANKGSQPWITNADPAVPATQYFTFNTPLEAAPDAQCGRVVYSDLHVGAASKDYKAGITTVPEGCTDADLTPQEKALEFMLFDLSSCVTPDSVPPTPPPPPAAPPK